MVPTSSILKMFDIIRDENTVSSYSTEELKGFLYVLQHGNLTRLRDNEDHPQLCCFFDVIRSFVNQVDMGK